MKIALDDSTFAKMERKVHKKLYQHWENAGVVHPRTGKTITSYRKLKTDPETRDIWIRAFGKEIGNLAQGDNLTGTKGTNTIIFMSHSDIDNIMAYHVVTYLKVVVDYRPRKTQIGFELLLGGT